MDKITIHSNITVVVTPDLKVTDLTDKTSLSPNKLRGVIDWAYEPVKILQGQGEYPSYILEWKTTRKLEEVGVITISSITKKAFQNESKKEVSQELKLDSKKDTKGVTDGKQKN